MKRRSILLVEDEPNLRRTLVDLLSQAYDVTAIADGIEGQQAAVAETFDLIVLDVMLPSRSGFEVCRHLRKNGITAPVLMLTARSELDNKIQGFKAGADDYLVKPFEAAELQIRIEALLRRAPSMKRGTVKTYQLGATHIDLSSSKVSKNGQERSLSERECRLLEYLIEKRGDTVTRDELLQEVWGYSALTLTRTVDVHVAWLRQKIEDDPTSPRFILTVHGQGYRFGG